MFLSLTPIVAGGRAIAALAITVASMSGHVSVGHVHADVSRAALGFLVLLAVAWGSSRRTVLIAGALLEQAIIHGTVHGLDAKMLAFHAASALVAGALTWHFEALWNASAHALAPLLSLPSKSRVPAVRPARQPHRNVWRNPFRAALLTYSSPRRGPPVFA